MSVHLSISSSAFSTSTDASDKVEDWDHSWKSQRKVDGSVWELGPGKALDTPKEKQQKLIIFPIKSQEININKP